MTTKNTKIDFTIKNQLVLWGEDSVIITSGKISNGNFMGMIIATCTAYHNGKLYKSTQRWYKEDKKLLSPLPPSLNFHIHNDEWY